MLWGWGQAAQVGTTIGLLIHLKGRDDGLGTHWITFDLCPRKSIAITAWRDGDERQERWDLNPGELLTLAEAAHTESIPRREAMITPKIEPRFLFLYLGDWAWVRLDAKTSGVERWRVVFWLVGNSFKGAHCWIYFFVTMKLSFNKAWRERLWVLVVGWK